MVQKPLDYEEERQKNKDVTYKDAFSKARTTFSGLPYDFANKKTFDDNPEQREQFYKSLFAEGGFQFWVGNYNEYVYRGNANHSYSQVVFLLLLRH